MTGITPGRHRHYKGNLYDVIGVARHSETEEELVVYTALYGDRGLWVRPLVMFLESVNIDGQAVPRFAPIDTDSGAHSVLDIRD
ncbi:MULTISPECIES: DUF1653 domain-containing protein [unclassified Cryobacterium]|uniref:DUF1653 domain-containing protein n=1 Tax=unclassified Cryobacterium TaxID=2649013 RepID=UPI002AB4DE27|nr:MULTISPECIES: DUF1653 domain-containing protein [unclassified Cryobacterium]MDY7527985.1 DUF1653 domain-containing protein [Cryobacterium sp. 10C2]MDY7556254.1 DUF1653 domain-containing protein [Cryobacterium sp. 10C3]MEB0002187.1 DUF1653 domain-containing protein [Cryobacterium sp. RTC2.1]MEB0201836.1 DUF1653 domain-containing protein [Cryobacterium sp. 5I3]MEB0290005.1 DUF1653 domain-containing protein [Cryobacterium sp. 10C2]